jgi:hypothetical protein
MSLDTRYEGDEWAQSSLRRRQWYHRFPEPSEPSMTTGLRVPTRHPCPP